MQTIDGTLNELIKNHKELQLKEFNAWRNKEWTADMWCERIKAYENLAKYYRENQIAI